MILSPAINQLFSIFILLLSAIHKIVDNWIQNIDEGQITCVCLFSHKKHFDSISHSVLLSKLDKYGIQSNELSWFNSYLVGQIQAWFNSYLVGQIQATCVHNNLSSFLSVKCGVPQGSILGSLLFIIFINDLPKYVQSCNLYADDTMIEKSGKTLGK